MPPPGQLPRQFEFLRTEPVPNLVREGMKLYGVFEYPSAADNPQIVNWAREVGGGGSWYDRDSIPWCGLFTAVCAKRSGKPVPRQYLRARSWEAWGTKAWTPMLGDILVFCRSKYHNTQTGHTPGCRAGKSGHVGIYVGETKFYYYVLGGNQKDSVCITRLAKNRLLSARHSWKVGPPKSRRQIKLGKFGGSTTNEA